MVVKENANEEQGEESEAGSATGAPRKLPFWRTMLSIVQASFGVQSRENRERDFSHGSIAKFIVAALLFTTTFVLVLLLVVGIVTRAGTG